MTLDELRRRFWWLGPSSKDSYIVAMDGDTVTIKVIQCTWNRDTQRYEAAVAADFAGLGLTVVWRPFFSPRLQETIDKARDAAAKQGLTFDEAAFIAENQARERRAGRDS